MNERRSLYRKMAYLLAAGVLLFPIAQLGNPSTRQEEGGTLAKIRADYDLGQSDLGEIDPASETIRLATLGLRGIAVSMLWSKGNDYKKREDWTNYRATLTQLAKLQPYFITFWRYQAWNLTYNVSVELDDVRDRYYYVRRGIEFLKEGTKYNRDSPYLLAELGWFIGNKVGRADEQKVYRRLFRADDDYHPEDRPTEQRDNWLVSKTWYQEAVDVVDSGRKSMGKKNPATFFADPPRSQMNYGEAIQKEGVFTRISERAWELAGEMWEDFGNRQFKSSRGFLISMNGLDKQQELVDKLQADFDALSPGVEAELLEIRRATLTEEERAAMEKDYAERSEEEVELALSGEDKLNINDKAIAEYVIEKRPDTMAQVRKLSSRLAQERSKLFLIRNNRDVANFAYWKTRCEFEQTEQARQAHRLSYAATRAFLDDADLLGSKKLFEEGFDLWAEAMEQNPGLEVDSPTGADIAEFVKTYARVLAQLDKSLVDPELADKFPLWEVLEANDPERDLAAAIDAWRARQEASPSGLPQIGGSSEDGADEDVADDSQQEASEPEGGSEAETGEQQPASPPNAEASVE
ncbi:MAG: hypothetical protein AAGA92_02270 [Planctomycetota bacterium]